MSRFLVGVLLVSAVFLAACEGVSQLRDIAATQGTSEEAEAQGEGGTTPTSPLETVTASILPTPEPAPTLDISSLEVSSERGVLTGVLRVRQAGRLVPVPDVKIGLGGPLLDNEGNVRIIGYDAAHDPTTMTDASGRFLFPDLAPGRYGLVLDLVVSSFLLFDESTGEMMLVDIEGGQVTDLGSLDYEELPIPDLEE